MLNQIDKWIKQYQVDCIKYQAGAE